MNKLVMIDNKPFLDTSSIEAKDEKALVTMPDGYILAEEDRTIEIHNECLRLRAEIEENELKSEMKIRILENKLNKRDLTIRELLKTCSIDDISEIISYYNNY